MKNNIRLDLRIIIRKHRRKYVTKIKNGLGKIVEEKENVKKFKKYIIKYKS